MGGVLGEAQAAVDQREASTRIDVDRRVDRVQDAGTDLRRGDRPRLRDDAPDLVAGAGASNRGQRDNGRENSAQRQGQNNQETEGLPIQFGSARQANSSPSRGFGTRPKDYH